MAVPALRSQSLVSAHEHEAVKRGHHFWTVLGASYIAEFICVMSHEVLGHGGAAYLWGVRDFHLYSTYIDFDYNGPSIGNRCILAAGTLVNLFLGGIGWLVLRRTQSSSANLRYFWLLFTAFNLFAAAIYPLYSAIVRGLDWQGVIEGLPHEGLLRLLMGLVGATLYLFFTWLCASELTHFDGDWWTLIAVPYFGTMLLSCLATYLGPLGMKMVWESGLPAIAVGYVGLLLMPPLAAFLKRGAETNLRIAPGPVLIVVGFLLGILLCSIGRNGVRWAAASLAPHRHRVSDHPLPTGQALSPCYGRPLECPQNIGESTQQGI
jgi:hypothetical protein